MVLSVLTDSVQWLYIFVLYFTVLYLSIFMHYLPKFVNSYVIKLLKNWVLRSSFCLRLHLVLIDLIQSSFIAVFISITNPVVFLILLNTIIEYDKTDICSKQCFLSVHSLLKRARHDNSFVNQGLFACEYLSHSVHCTYITYIFHLTYRPV